VRDAVARALAEDLTPLGDLTSSLLPPDLDAIGELVPRQSGVLAGADCVEETYRQLDNTVSVTWSACDGDEATGGTAVGVVRGPLAAILTGERTALNFLCHLSGVATLTRRFVDAAAASGGRARVWDTRKTTPGLRPLEKAAVRSGGAINHRGNLSDWVMFKDNHLAVLGIDEAVQRARARWPGRLVHVEVTTLAELDDALAAGADAVLLDNMSVEDAREAVNLADEFAAQQGRRPLLECSGGITLETAAAYGATGVDLLSTSQITQSAPALDIGLDVRTGGASR
jgi:nicotinate-nucleotide pyrophosphorylase (carboxylating)